MRFYYVISVLLFWTLRAVSQNSCGSPATVTAGGCTTFNITNSSGAILAGCNGGNHPLAFLSFTAPANGNCVQMNFSGITSGGTYQIATFTTGCAAYVAGSAACVENVVAGAPFSYSGISATGTSFLTPGTSYVIAIQSNSATAITSCMTSTSAPAPTDACGGGQQIGTSPTTLYNGGDCQFSGSYDNAASVDPPALQLCAGTLENTQWTTFVASATTIQIVGSSISCTGGGCGFQFGMFTGTCGALNNIGCYGNKVCTGGQSTQGPTNPAGQVTWSGLSTTGFTATISGLTIGQTVYLVMDGNADADCRYTLAGINVLAVPVEMVSFTANVVPAGVELNWMTASEKNNEYFSVERSENANYFYEIGRVPGSLNSFDPVSYEFLDPMKRTGPVYYRLCQYDTNGDKSYSTIVAVGEDGLNKIIVRRINLLGMEVNQNYRGIVVEIFDDGSTRKVMQ